jgi:very-short-patch-repair endonuclease/DNA polymerase III delta prime subunit
MRVTAHEPDRRRTLIGAAVKTWVDALIDLGGRNNLIYYRDLRVGTLDLGEADPTALTQLHGGRTVRLSRLFPEERGVDLPVKNARRIHEKIRELDEERGIRAGYLAVGMATWTDPEGRRTPNAPVLLRHVRLDPVGGAQADFELQLADEIEINPVLAHLLATLFNIRLDVEELASLVDLSAGLDPWPVYEALRKQAREVQGFAVTQREVIGTFTYAKLPMVTDLQASLDLLTANDVVSAIAGDPLAASALRAGEVNNGETPLDLIPSRDEFVVLDTDSSQTRAINAVLNGSHLVVKGPPGTGKSQTISNLISTLVARGRKVLFVAEKRAAIDAVLHRLQLVGLSELVMDLHEGATHRRSVAESLARSLDQAARIPRPDLAELHQRLDRTRQELASHASRLHTRRSPWGLSLFDAQAAAMATPPELRATTRFRGEVLRGLSSEVADQARRQLREYVQVGGLDQGLAASPWAGSPISTPEQAELAFEIASQIAAQSLPQARAELSALLTETGLMRPINIAQWRDAFALLDSVSVTLEKLSPDVYTADLQQLCAATGNGAYRKQHTVRQRFLERRRLVRDARALWRSAERPHKAEMHDALCTAARDAATWAAVSTDGRSPRLPSDLPVAESRYGALAQDLQALAAHLATVDLLQLDPDAVSQRVENLTADVATLQKLPRLNALEAWLTSFGLVPLLQEARAAALDADRAVTLFDDAWHRSILDQVGMSEPAYGAFAGQVHRDVVREFVHADADHLASTPDRVKRAAAESLIAALNAHEDQARLVRAEAAKQRRHKPLRELWRLAPDVLLAVKPCWAMSPLVVSQVLPARQLFDVVIFDEASQVIPADAMTSLMRARRAVVAGDEHQLPPTSFFAAAVTEDEIPEVVATEEGTLEISLTSGYESILDVLGALLPWRSLTWHYRSRDERLIAFSNAHIYDSSLVTFPGIAGQGCLRHVNVPQDSATPGQEESVAAEARRVVDLVIDHAETQPHESLGVITMGIKHAERIQAELLTRLANRRDLDEFFAETRDERFFVKNLERVQGDERDAIILSIGYGKGPDGRMRYRWGPLNTKGGERRLNVAVTRAKSRLTLVSSFTAYDVDPNAIRAEGAKMLRAYLEFAASGGEFLGSGLTVGPELNPFEIDVRDRLTRAGVPLVAQYGVSGYRIDFAAAHPRDAGRMVLAIEADGASYHSAESARDRDRIRQQHLQNLGWTFYRIWSTDWFRDPDTEIAKVRLAYDQAVARADASPTRASSPGSNLPRPRPDQPRIEAATPARGPRPRVPPGLPITEYSSTELRAVVRYVTSDNLLRTDEEILREVMGFLGFQRGGSRIRQALQTAIAMDRQ